MNRKLLLFLLGIVLGGCRPYKVTIEQGNVLDEKIVATLKIGMDKSKVAAILGDPVLLSPIDSNSWIYVYTKTDDRKKVIRNKLILNFKGNELIAIK